MMAIHQSRSDRFPTFQDVLFLARGGQPVYAGSGKDMVGYFAGSGYPCPENVNLADFAVDLITVALRNAAQEAYSQEKVQRLIQGWSKIRISLPLHSSSESLMELRCSSKSTATVRFSVFHPDASLSDQFPAGI